MMVLIAGPVAGPAVAPKLTVTWTVPGSPQSKRMGGVVYAAIRLGVW